MEGRYLGWVGRGRERVRQPQKKRGDRGRKIVLRDICASSPFLQAFIKEQEGKQQCCYFHGVGAVVTEREMTIDSAKPTCNYSRFHDQKNKTLPMKSPEIQIVALVQFIMHPHRDTCTATQTHARTLKGPLMLQPLPCQ